MIWQDVKSIEEVNVLSKTKKVLIFKHSTRCSISSAALSRFERNWKEEYNDKIKLLYLDLIANRLLSNQIAEHYFVRHESPQILLISDGKCIYNTSHLDISVGEVIKQL
ncbi:MAG: bacillithiol system redox-active protein YtxJ [Bacteroidota bacterium]|nr:bacillithiol system redox-active protein YtxJ [Bacteroidota bacterium]